jgi:hypothetical protein
MLTLSQRRDIKRLRKSKGQTSHLMQLFHSSKGEPSREEITALAEMLDLKELQVYKWMWDTQGRQDRNTQ